MRVHVCTKKEREVNVKLEFRSSLRSSFYPIFKISEESSLHFSDVVKQISLILRHPTLCCIQSCLTLCDPLVAHHHGQLICPWDSPGKNTGVDCHVLLQGFFPPQGLNPRLWQLLHWQAVLYH